MSWKVRHEGSPKSVEGLTLQQVAEGLQDGHWEPTDEVMGPGDKGWVAIENHPKLADVVADLEPPPPPHHEDESHLDMNALIDVCLVLLIFFILTTSYAELQKMINSPAVTASGDENLPVVKKEVVDKTMILVQVREGDKGPVISVEGKEVPKDALAGLFRNLKGQNRSTVLIDHDRSVPHGTIVAIEDAAATAKIDQVLIAIPKDELKK